jgi:hypothetical protein
MIKTIESTQCYYISYFYDGSLLLADFEQWR